MYSHASQTSVESGRWSLQFGHFLNVRRSTGWCSLAVEIPLLGAVLVTRTAMINNIAKRKKPFRSSAITIAPSSGAPVHLLANLLEQQTCPDENSTVCHQTLEASTSSRSSLPRIMSKIRERSFWPYRNYRCGVLLEVALWRTTYACRVSFRSWGEAF